jgi:hypothetical protein
MSEIALNHPRVAKVIEYHQAATTHAKNAIACAVRAGAELIALKEEIGHGEFESFARKNFPFGKSTAWRYMTVASQVSKVSHVKHLESAPDEKLLKAIHHASQAANISGLYKDLGVIKDQRIAKKVERDLEADRRTTKDEHQTAMRDVLITEDLLVQVLNRNHLLNDRERAMLAWTCLAALEIFLEDAEIQLRPHGSTVPRAAGKVMEERFGFRPSNLLRGGEQS